MTSSTLAPAGSRTARPGRGRSRRVGLGQSAWAPWIFVAPFLIIFGVFTLVPLVSSFAMSFTDFKATDVQSPFGVNFVGLDQYISLFGNAQFLHSLGNTAYFVLVGIPLTMIVALALAVALNNGIRRFRAVFRVGFYVPVVCSIVAISTGWRFILQDDGPLNGVLALVGIHGPDWLNSTTWAMPAIIVMAAWRNVGTLMIIFLAGLQAVPAEVQEAGMMDGAGAWKRFTAITLPILRPTILLGSVLISVGYLQFFEEAFVMTGGGPLDSTLSITYFIYKQFGFGQYGLASAASYLLFIVIALVSVIQFRTLRSQD
ncbi:sugar ABC transporter permease [Leifsonia sp. NPDC080035]|uniref:Sugar ABC transporter permease n=1 Tax=Leifsonia sp. NPDC080035 TaxID=3143936 RepID=A0AAU7G7A2_9MICO